MGKRRFTRARRKCQERAGSEDGQHTRNRGGEDDPEKSGQSAGMLARAYEGCFQMSAASLPPFPSRR